MEISMQGEKLSMLFDRFEAEILQQAFEEHAFILEKRMGDGPCDPGSFVEYQKRDLDRVEAWLKAIDKFLND